MAGYSPYGTAPGGDFYRDKERFSTPTPSPRGPSGYYYGATPQRSSARQHSRRVSSGMNDYTSPRPAAFSPRYNSDGLYSTNAATANVSASRSSRKQSFSAPRPKHERRSSYSYHWIPDPNGESDEEVVRLYGIPDVIPVKSRSKRQSRQDEGVYYSYGHERGQGTDHRYHVQTSSRRHPDLDRSEPFRYHEEPRRSTHTRRASHSMPQRSHTTKPTSSHPRPPPAHRSATQADADKFGIPKGFSLKNWDPTEEPITLLGSVFDANSLGKWIYDWTVYALGSSTPISEEAGELWLLLIRLAGNMKRAREIVPRIRTFDNKEMVEDFLESGERLTDKLRELLKSCEKPMMKAASKKKDSQLGQRAGEEFVETMFGRERKLEKTEQFMQSVRLWNLRFDANCEDVLMHPER